MEDVAIGFSARIRISNVTVRGIKTRANTKSNYGADAQYIVVGTSLAVQPEILAFSDLIHRPLILFQVERRVENIFSFLKLSN